MGIGRAFIPGINRLLQPCSALWPPTSLLLSILVLGHPHSYFPWLLRVWPLGRGCLGPSCGVRLFALDSKGLLKYAKKLVSGWALGGFLLLLWWDPL